VCVCVCECVCVCVCVLGLLVGDFYCNWMYIYRLILKIAPFLSDLI